MIDHQQCLFELNVLCMSTSYDTLEHLKEVLCAGLSYFDDNIFPQKDMEMRQKIYRTIKMVEQLGKND